MSKKNFSGSIDSLFQKNEQEPIKEPNDKSKLEETESTRTTIIVNIATYDKIKAIAYWERKSIKVIIEKAFQQILRQYSNENLQDILESYKRSNP